MRRWKFGRVMGIDLYVHWSFFLLPAYVVYNMWDRSLAFAEQSQVLFALGCLFALFACVILHELGHARMARAFGIPTRDITISAIGGIARLERMSDQPWEELLIAIAGPAVNVVISLGLLVVLVPLHFKLGLHLTPENSWRGFLLFLFLANIVMVVFNMLPAFPMDGGRMLRAVLSMGMDHVAATEVAVYVGAFMAVLLGLYGLLETLMGNNGLMLMVLAGFVFLLGQGELMMTRRRYAALAEPPVEVLPADDLPVPPTDHTASGFSGLAWDGSRRAWVFWLNGRPVSTHGAKPE
jgi:Zn-dependent protease